MDTNGFNVRASPPFSQDRSNTAERNAAVAVMNTVIHASILPGVLVSDSPSRKLLYRRQTQRKAASRINRTIKALTVNALGTKRAGRLNRPNNPSPRPAPTDMPFVYSGPPFWAVSDSPTSPIEASRSAVERALISGVTPRRTSE